MVDEVETAADEKPATHNKQAQTFVLGTIVLILVLVSFNAVMRASGTKDEKEEAAPRVVMQEDPASRANSFNNSLDQATRSAERAAKPVEESYKETINRLTKQEPQEQETKPADLAGVEVDKWILEERDRVRQSRYDDYDLSLGFGSSGSSNNKRLVFNKELPKPQTIEDKISQIKSQIDLNQQKQLEALERTVSNDAIGSNTGFNLAALANTAPSAQPAIVGQSKSLSPRKAPLPGQKLLPVASFIRAAIDQKVMSDYVGPFRCRITQDVYDVSNSYILIPQGSTCNARSLKIVNVNEPIQARMGYMIQNVILPNGKLIDFSRQAGLDREGIAAVKDEVNRHLLAQFLGVAAYALISTESSYTGSGANSDDTYAGQVSSNSRDLGSRVAEKYLNLVPTITLNPGTGLRIFIEEEMYITPWGSIGDDYVG
jgi:type IV secretion system protein VirB10